MPGAGLAAAGPGAYHLSMRLTARLAFHLMLLGILVPALTVPLVWALALAALRRPEPADKPWRVASVALAVADTVIAVLLLAGVAGGSFPPAEVAAEPAAGAALGLFEPTDRLPETGPAGPWQIGALGAFLTGVLALWIAGRARGARGGRFWLGFLGVLVASTAVAGATAVALGVAAGGPSLGALLLALAAQATAMGGLALLLRNGSRRRGALRESAGEPLSVSAAVLLGTLYLMTGAMRLGLLLGLLVALTPLEAPSPTEAPLQLLAQMQLEPVALALFVGTVVILGPVAEELLFRGALVPWLAKVLNPWWAAWLAGLLFALLHVHYGPFVLVVALYGGILGWARLRTGGLAAPILLHVLINGMAALALV